MGYRALLSVPLVREDDVIGALAVARKACAGQELRQLVLPELTSPPPPLIW
jgi:hypothetical protein